MNILYKRIRERREKLGLTQEDLAKKLGYKSRSSINKIELGENDILQSKIIAFAKALETTPAYLMGWDDDMPPEKEKEPPSNTKMALAVQKLLEEKGVIPPGGDLTKEQTDIILNYISANADFLRELVKKNK